MNYQPGFAEHLDLLIELFRKLRALHGDTELQQMDKSFFDTIDILLANYDLIRSTVPREMLNQLGQPIHDLLLELIDQLRQELGENENPDTPVGGLLSEINNIDALLKKKDLGYEEMNQLLDERSRLMQQRDKKESDE